MTGRRIGLPAALLGALLAACSSATPEMRKEAAARMEMGITYLNQRNIPQAMQELTKAEDLDPDNPQVAMVLGLAYQTRGEYGKAEKYFRRAIRKKPDYGDAHNNYGYLLSTLGRSDEAIREYELAVANVLYGTPEVAYSNLGEEYRRRKDLKKAELMYRRAIAFNERYPVALRGMALVLGDEGNWAEAVKSLERCVDMAPDFWLAWIDLGKARLHLGRRDDALKAFNTALGGAADPKVKAMAAESIRALSGTKRK